MKNLTLITAIVISGMILIAGCKKEDPTTEVVVKHLDYITQADERVYEFYYENDTISEYSYRGSDSDEYDFDARFENGRIHQYAKPGNEANVEFIFSGGNDSAWLVFNGYPDSVYASYLLNSDGRVTNSTVYSEEGSTDYKYYYTSGNVTKIDIVERFKHTKRWSLLLEYDNNPNPWYEMNTLDDYRSFSKNNITSVNNYPYNRWEYDEDGYPAILNSTIDGQYKYYYK